MHAHSHTYTHIHQCTLTYSHACTHTHIHTHTYTNVHTHTHTHARTLTYIHTHTPMYTHILTHAHTYAYTHTHTLTLTRTHTHSTHFQQHLAENRQVRFIYRGRILSNDTQTLQELEITNNSALHVHIGTPRPQGVCTCMPSLPVGGAFASLFKE